MEISFGELKEREVINVTDGKSYGRVTDIIFTFPEGRVQGFMVPGKRGFNWFRQCPDIFIDIRRVKTIGGDVILVDMRKSSPNPPPPPKKHGAFPEEEEDCFCEEREDF